MIMKQTTLLL